MLLDRSRGVPLAQQQRVARLARAMLVAYDHLAGNGLAAGLDPQLPVRLLADEGQVVAAVQADRAFPDVLTGALKRGSEKGSEKSAMGELGE